MFWAVMLVPELFRKLGKTPGKIPTKSRPNSARSIERVLRDSATPSNEMSAKSADDDDDDGCSGFFVHVVTSSKTF